MLASARFSPPIRPSAAPLGCELLLAGIAAGDKDAFDDLYRGQITSVLALTTRLLRDRHQGEEVAHEVMLSIWQRAGQFDPALGSGRSWILQLARSRAIDRIRSSEHSRARDLQYTRDAPRGTIRDPFDLVVARTDAATLRIALLQLSAVQRESLVLAFFSRYSYPEIAERLQVPLPTVKTRIRDGLIRLRTLLAEQVDPLAA